MSFPRYESYKDSGVEWLGEIPENWTISRLKYCLKLNSQKENTSDFELKLGLENIQSWTGQLIQTDSEFSGNGVCFETGDILFGKLRPYLAKVYLAGRNGVAVGDFFVMNPQNNLHGRFAQYQILTKEFIRIVDGSTFGAKMPRVNWEFMANMPLTFPPLPEQQAIASFLDQETTKIDKLTAEQQRLIELLKEKRQAVISHAVTKGLNPQVPMKDSGIPWLGEIPEHWEISRIKIHCSIISKGTTPTTEGGKFSDSGVRFFKAENITERGLCLIPEFFITEELNLQLKRSILNDGDVLVVIAGATTGKTAIVEQESLPANTNQAVCFLRPYNLLFGQYISFWIKQAMIQDQIRILAVQAAQPNLSMGDLGNILILVPDESEIRNILSFINSYQKQIDELLDEAEQLVRFLQERRSSLISAAVTGKIDVRNYVPSQEAA